MNKRIKINGQTYQMVKESVSDASVPKRVGSFKLEHNRDTDTLYYSKDYNLYVRLWYNNKTNDASGVQVCWDTDDDIIAEGYLDFNFTDGEEVESMLKSIISVVDQIPSLTNDLKPVDMLSIIYGGKTHGAKMFELSIGDAIVYAIESQRRYG